MSVFIIAILVETIELNRLGDEAHVVTVTKLSDNYF